jgi:hypothetical protein
MLDIQGIYQVPCADYMHDKRTDADKEATGSLSGCLGKRHRACRACPGSVSVLMPIHVFMWILIEPDERKI